MLCHRTGKPLHAVDGDGVTSSGTWHDSGHASQDISVLRFLLSGSFATGTWSSWGIVEAISGPDLGVQSVVSDILIIYREFLGCDGCWCAWIWGVTLFGDPGSKLFAWFTTWHAFSSSSWHYMVTAMLSCHLLWEINLFDAVCSASSGVNDHVLVLCAAGSSELCRCSAYVHHNGLGLCA